VKIAITGGYGSGKSSVSRLITMYLGATLFDADGICKELLQPGEEGYTKLINEFGARFISREGYVDRALLRDVTFTDETIKARLEGILHPLVRKRLHLQGIEAADHSSFLVAEVPLLYEVGWQGDFDTTVLVRVDYETSVSRVTSRDNIQREEASRIIDLQLPMTCKEPLADYIIDNGSTFVSTAQQTAWLANVLHEQICIK
jgi:dephospho-CoA kinase